MKAVGYYKAQPIAAAEALVDLDLPEPKPGPRDLLVRVKAVAVNPVDTKIRAGTAPEAGQARVLGWDAAGVVEAVGTAVASFKPGDEVFYSGARERPGANSELHCIDARLVGAKPKSLGFAEAAAMPLTALTAWELLFDRLRVAPSKAADDRSLLIIGGAGGVGSMLIQLARRLTSLTVIATASRPETADWCRSLGAHHVVDHAKPLPDELTRVGFPAVSFIAGLTQTEKHLPAIGALIAPQGHFATIDPPNVMDIAVFKRKSASIHPVLMFTRSSFETPDMAAQGRALDEISALVDAGVLRTTMTKTLSPISAANLQTAHALVESGRMMGKVVLEGW